MKDQPWDLNQVVSIYKCPQTFWGGPPLKPGAQKHPILDHFFRNFCTRNRTSPELNIASTNKKANINLQ